MISFDVSADDAKFEPLRAMNDYDRWMCAPT